MIKNGEQKPIQLRMLIADDVWATIQSIRLMLKMLPDVEVVATARDGRQAIDKAEEFKPDIALVDINMPVFDGLTVIRKMLEQQPEMVCIIISVEGDRATVEQAKACGALDFLIKPFTTEELIATVERAGQLVHNRRPETRDTGMLRRNLTTAPLRKGQTSELYARREADLQELARQYLKENRTDDQVIAILEELAARPYCEIHWLKWLAIIYVKRTKWEKLRLLSKRLEQYPTEKV